MDRFEAMTLLQEVVDRGSLSAASRSLRIPVPTLSRKILDLEARLGTRLFLRTTRRLTLTDAGVTYLTAALRILNEVDETEREAAGEFTVPKDDLVITVPLQFGRLHVLPAIAESLALFPAIDVRLALADRNVHLVDDHIDVAVRIDALRRVCQPGTAGPAWRAPTPKNLGCLTMRQLRPKRGRPVALPPRSDGNYAGHDQPPPIRVHGRGGRPRCGSRCRRDSSAALSMRRRPAGRSDRVPKRGVGPGRATTVTGLGRDGQAAMVGRLTVSSSPIGAMLSSVM